MSQMFFGNSRVMLFTPNSSSAPAGHSDTRVTYTSESGHADWSGEIEGDLNLDSIPNRDDIETVDIGTSVTRIDDMSFASCSGLTSVTIPYNVTSFGAAVFADCNNLTTITVLGRTTSDAQELLANSDVPAGCTIVGELG